MASLAVQHCLERNGIPAGVAGIRSVATVCPRCRYVDPYDPTRRPWLTLTILEGENEGWCGRCGEKSAVDDIVRALSKRSVPLLQEQDVLVAGSQPAIPRAKGDGFEALSERASPTFRILPWGEFDRLQFPEERWWIENLIPSGCSTIIAAPSGEKKSWVALEMARCIASGTPFAGYFKTKQARVLYIEQETSQHELQRRGRQLGIGVLGDRVQILSQDFLSLNGDQVMDALFAYIQANGIDVVFTDTLRSVAGGLHEEKAEEVRMFFARFKPWKDRGVTAIFLDHCRKPRPFESAQVPRKDQVLGSQDKVAAVEMLHMLRSKQDSEEVFFYPMKSKVDKGIPPFKLIITDKEDTGLTTTSITYDGIIDEKQLKSEEAEEAKELIRGFLLDNGARKNAKQIKEALEGRTGDNAVDAALKEMRETNEIGYEQVGHPFWYWMPKDTEGSGEKLSGEASGSLTEMVEESHNQAIKSSLIP